MFKIPIAKLEGDNWLTWSRVVRSTLNQYNRLAHLNDEPPNAGADNYAAWRTIDLEVQNLFLSTVSEQVSLMLLDENLTAKTMFERLSNRFNPNNDARRTQITQTIQGRRPGLSTIYVPNSPGFAQQFKLQFLIAIRDWRFGLQFKLQF